MSSELYLAVLRETLSSVFFTALSSKGSTGTSEGHNLGSEAPVEPLDESDVKNTELNVSRKTAK